MEFDKTICNDFEKSLVGSGYNFFCDTWKGSIKGIQKRFDDEKGTKYFITAYHYNFAKQFPDRHDMANDNIDRYTFTAQFNRDEKSGKGKCQTIDISFSADFVDNPWRPLTTLKEVEDFFEKMFIDFEFDYYEMSSY